jgi:hypothetical protein
VSVGGEGSAKREGRKNDDVVVLSYEELHPERHGFLW